MKAQSILLTGDKHFDVIKKYQEKGIAKDKAIILLDNEVKDSNILSVIFKVEEAAFYAGYLSAKFISDSYYQFDKEGTKGLKVTAIGGEKERNSVAYMAGFQQGVEYWNENLGNQDKKIEFVKLGDDINAHFTSSYTIGEGKAMAKTLIANKIDVVLAANRGQIIDLLKETKEQKQEMLFVGTDVDMAGKYDDYYDRFMTSVVKDLRAVVRDAIATIYDIISYDNMGLGYTFVATVKSTLVGLGKNLANKIIINEFEELKDDKKFKKAAEAATINFKL